MTIRNSTLLEPERLVFSVLGRIKVQLFPGLIWQGEDISSPTAQGSAFYGYEDPPTDPAVASIQIVDVSGDPTEPDIISLDEAGVGAVDGMLRRAVEAEMDVVNWMSSQLNVSEHSRGLVTPYIIRDSGRDVQYVALRTVLGQTKYVIIGTFDVSKSDPLAKFVFRAIQTVSFTEC